MESDLGKLFIGGIAWETTEDHMREYFEKFGEVVEAVIIRDRITGRARGFGFVVFADPAVAERVVMEKHLIDGKMVEAKKAVPKVDQHIFHRNNSSVQSSPGPCRTKKIFVGGLASTVTDADFKRYFEQFGIINDVVVMYDHNTQRPRGFGFITFDSEDSVDKVLHKTFHELNGKMVEVKRAVPKELSPGPNVQIPIGGYNHGLNRINNFLSLYGQGYNAGSIGSYDMRMYDRSGPLASGRKLFPSLSPGYGIGMNADTWMNPSYGGISNYDSGLGFGRALSPHNSGSSSRLDYSIGHGGGSGTPGLAFSSAARTLWGNGSLYNNANLTNLNSYLNSGSGSLSGFGNNGLNWGDLSSPPAAHVMGSDSGFNSTNLNDIDGENGFGVAAANYRSSATGSINTSFAVTSNAFERNFTNSYNGRSVIEDPIWQSSSSEFDGFGSFSNGLGSSASDIASKGSTIYMNGYNILSRQITREG